MRVGVTVQVIFSISVCVHPLVSLSRSDFFNPELLALKTGFWLVLCSLLKAVTNLAQDLLQKESPHTLEEGENAFLN